MLVQYCSMPGTLANVSVFHAAVLCEADLVFLTCHYKVRHATEWQTELNHFTFCGIIRHPTNVQHTARLITFHFGLNTHTITLH